MGVPVKRHIAEVVSEHSKKCAECRENFPCYIYKRLYSLWTGIPWSEYHFKEKPK